MENSDRIEENRLIDQQIRDHQIGYSYISDLEDNFDYSGLAPASKPIEWEQVSPDKKADEITQATTAHVDAMTVVAAEAHTENDWKITDLMEQLNDSWDIPKSEISPETIKAN